MVEELEKKYGNADRRVLKAMLDIPRHLFVRKHLWAQAYGDHALPIGAEQTISQPFVVARMSEMLRVSPEHTVLEIGTGTGYQTAILAKLARRVYSLERVGELARAAIDRLRSIGIPNVKVQAFDGTVGWSEVAPFARILVTAAAPSAPKPLIEQLRPGGRMVIPEGSREEQRLVSYRKLRGGGVRREEGEAVAFVPLIGRYGWAS